MLSFIYSAQNAYLLWAAHTPQPSGAQWKGKLWVKVDLHDIKGNLFICFYVSNLCGNSLGKKEPSTNKFLKDKIKMVKQAE